MSEPFEGRRSQTEAEAEEEWARCELLGQRIHARLDREGNEAFERIVEEELERMSRERGELELAPEVLGERVKWLEELDGALKELDEQIEGVERGTDHGRLEKRHHALVEKAMRLSQRMHRTAERQRWLPGNATPEHPIAELIGSTIVVGPKLAGALHGEDWPPAPDFCAHTIVRLKRAREYLEDALRAAEACQEEKLIGPSLLELWTKELTELQSSVDGLIAELRQRLAEGG